MYEFPDLDAVTRDGEVFWANDKSIRAEFRGNKDAYLAYRRAEAKGVVPLRPATAQLASRGAQGSR